jgi:hypothetical protein
MGNAYLSINVTLDGNDASLGEWVKKSQISPMTVLLRLYRGKSPLEALAAPDNEGHYLKTNNGLEVMSYPCNPTVTIGCKSNTLKEWSKLASIRFHSLVRAVNGGISPFDALTFWCDRNGNFWRSYWKEQFQAFEKANPSSPVAPEEVEAIKTLYLAAQTEYRPDPLKNYCNQIAYHKGKVDIRKEKEHYIEETGTCSRICTIDWVNDPDETLVVFFRRIDFIQQKLKRPLAPMLESVLVARLEEQNYMGESNFHHQFSSYVYRRINAELGNFEQKYEMD